MKRIMDALKDIITQDASTQTEPVIITPIQEEGMTTEGMNVKRKGSDLGGEGGEEGEEIHKKLKITEDVSKTISGKEHAQHRQQAINPEQDIDKKVTPVSFHDKCKSYISKIYPDEPIVSAFLDNVSFDLGYSIINKNPRLNVQTFIELIKNRFSSNASGDFYTDEENKGRLTIEAAAIYLVCTDTKDIQDFMRKQGGNPFTDPGLLQNALKQYLTEVTDTELAGEIFKALDDN
jgi:hypothetical protein